jgi:caa(3)-type oxidase subunit IV
VSAQEGQQHPIAIYLWIWLLLFVFSAFSYAVDYFHLQGALRWTLILVFMFLKAGFIVAIFMHMRWERLALKLAILVPPLALLILIGLMAIEGDYTFLTRSEAFTNARANAAPAEHRKESSPYNAAHDAQTRSVTSAEQGP